MRHAAWLSPAVFVLFLPLSALGQTTCGTVKQGEELKNPPEIPARGGVLSTEFDVRFQTFCIPETDNKDGTWRTSPLKLRTYVTPARPLKPEDTPRPATDLTGPTLRLRKASQPNQAGESLAVLLKNSLPYPDSTGCNSACSAGTACNCAPANLEALIKKCTQPESPNGPPPAECCCVVNCTQKAPNCLHGDNVTNLHFHGSHASPQSPQDFVLLDLYPNRPPGAPEVGHGSHGVHSMVAYGQFQYKVAPFGWQQAEGTHWYHPHKHGSVGVQVANGMAGALLIEGPFDDWLRQFYDPVRGEKVMVIQSVTSEEPLFRRDTPNAQTLVNGQIKPTITMAPGEIQRWRFVNATMSSRTLLEITLPPGVTFRQIAMDGVRFSPINYECQPLLNFNQNNPSFPCTPNPTGSPKIRIAPGNRADFLVQAPLKETKKGTEGLRIERKIVEIAGEERGGHRKLLRAREEEAAPGPAEPALFTMIVDDGIEGNDDQPKMLKAGAPQFPTTLPPMPDYLLDIKDEHLNGKPVEMTFQQFLAGRDDLKWPYSQSPLSSFKIDERQFDPACANITTVLGTAAQWTVSNATLLPHPFHIHTNPFLVYSVKGVPVRPAGQTRPEPFWMDTLALSVATVSPSAPPQDPFTTPITITPASVVLRQRYRQFTGQYVLHCHFLGHEDRGMMFSVQTVCNDQYPNSAGKYGLTKYPEECAGPGPFPDPLPACK